MILDFATSKVAEGKALVAAAAHAPFVAAASPRPGWSGKVNAQAIGNTPHSVVQNELKAEPDEFSSISRAMWWSAT